MKQSALNCTKVAAVEIGPRKVPPTAAVDDLDDLFDYDIDDVFRNVNTNMDVASQHKAAGRAEGKEHTVGLGIDEEIKVSKKRAPVPKLDEERLLGPTGIPKLRGITKERLKFKGKGHEYSDVARLLNVYQLWLDELYPRAKFADGLAIIEKLGHTKRMQTMRREWINEGKPRKSLESFGNASQKPASKWPIPKPMEGSPRTDVPGKRLETPAVVDDGVDFYEATPKEGEKEEISKRTNAATPSLFVSDDEDMDDFPPADELDVILAEDEGQPQPLGTIGNFKRKENFADEMEAMASVEDLR